MIKPIVTLRKPTLLVMAVIGLGLSHANKLTAQNNQRDVNNTSQPLNLELDELVVTGTRTEKMLLGSPVKTELVTRMQIEKIHARDLTEAIEYLPGAMLRKVHGKTGQEVWLQGVDADRVAVLINGERVAASTGSAVDLSQIAALDIERVEIIKGPTSVLYGSSAIGGVINVFTREPEPGFHYSLTIDGGSFGDQNPEGTSTDIANRHVGSLVSLVDEALTYMLTFDERDSDGFKVDTEAWEQHGAIGQKRNGLARVSFNPNDNQEYTVSASIYDEDVDNLFSVNAGGKIIPFTKKEEAIRNHISATGNWLIADNDSLNVQLYHDSFTDKTNQDNANTPFMDQERDADMQASSASLQWDHHFNDHQILTMGLEGFYEELHQEQFQRTENSFRASVEVSDAKRDSLDLYVQHDAIFGRWEFVPGVRIQDDSDFGSHITPKLNALYYLETIDNDHYFRFGMGLGYRVPNLKERYFTFDHSHLGYMVIGNQQLTPEESKNLQLGWSVSNIPTLLFDIGLFYNDLDDLITTDIDPVQSSETGLQISVYKNLNKARIKGGEFSLRWLPYRNTIFNWGYTYLDAIDRATKKRLTQRPRHLVKAAIEWQFDLIKSDLSLNYQWQDKEWADLANTRDSPSWSKIDLKFNYHHKQQLTLFSGIDNLLDEQRDFSDSDDKRPEEGRMVYIGLRIES